MDKELERMARRLREAPTSWNRTRKTLTFLAPDAFPFPVKTFHTGQRVVMPKDETDGWPEVRGVVLEGGTKSTFIVELDPRHKHDQYDDLIREVSCDGMVSETANWIGDILNVIETAEKKTKQKVRG